MFNSYHLICMCSNTFGQQGHTFLKILQMTLRITLKIFFFYLTQTHAQ
jgi:hypothetical protein